MRGEKEVHDTKACGIKAQKKSVLRCYKIGKPFDRFCAFLGYSLGTLVDS
jgi:hypothetical protein